MVCTAALCNETQSMIKKVVWLQDEMQFHYFVWRIL